MTKSKKHEINLPPGNYVLPTRWTPDKPDRRKTGIGVDTPQGFYPGTRFLVESDPHLGIGRDEDGSLRVSAPFEIGHTAIAHNYAGAWFCDDSVATLLRSLVPDDSIATKLDHAIGAHRHMSSRGDDVLHRLVADGVVSVEQVGAIVAQLDAELDAEGDEG